MTETAFAELRRSVQLKRFLWAEARRLFAKDKGLQEAAVSAAWKQILAQPAGQDFEKYKRQGALAIAAVKDRKPPSALAQLAQRAIDKNWQGE